jgi:hypothetical protein
MRDNLKSNFGYTGIILDYNLAEMAEKISN